MIRRVVLHLPTVNRAPIMAISTILRFGGAVRIMGRPTYTLNGTPILPDMYSVGVAGHWVDLDVLRLKVRPRA